GAVGAGLRAGHIRGAARRGGLGAGDRRCAQRAASARNGAELCPRDSAKVFARAHDRELSRIVALARLRLGSGTGRTGGSLMMPVARLAATAAVICGLAIGAAVEDASAAGFKRGATLVEFF